ncbi:MAG: LamG domain-containing protein, partial [Verrucomicrobiae bacterium]|nr:LamG domain-containing protein [Verrucomicrobiae bacterium]
MQGSAREASGLLHWWPDPVEGTDEVTGRRGIRRGFGELEAEPEVRLGYAAGWTELGPGITNQIFTLTFWMQSAGPSFEDYVAVLSQDSGLNDGWAVQQRQTGTYFEWVTGFFGPPSTSVLGGETPVRRWQAVALQVTPTEVQLWMDGRPHSKGAWKAPVSTHPGPLCVGNSVIGAHPWNGDLRDLRIFDRLLEETEIQELAQRPRSPPRDHPPATRLVPFTKVSLPTVKAGDYQIRRFTTDNGLPNAGIQCLTQGQDRAVWLGFEGALFRFDGRRFEMADSGTPDFPLSPPDVCNLTEDSAGNLWLGLYHGLVRKAPDRWTAFTNLGSGRFVTRVLPQDDGTLWLTTIRDQPPRGRHYLKHFDPRTGTLLVDIPITGDVRDLRPAPEGIWVATDNPAALWHYDPRSHAFTLAVNLAGGGETLPGFFPEGPVIRVAEAAVDRGIRVEAWQEENGPLQWAL